MSQTREEAQWRRGKSEVISKYRQDHEKLFSVVAARGFTTLPGFAYDTGNRLELAAKLKLSELNLKLLTETVEREIKQAGIDYDIAYRTAEIAWEIDKEELLAAWQGEYSVIKQNMAHDEEVLDRLALELKIREALLINSKTDIETQAEEYRRQIAELDDETADYEVTLAQKKLLTATRRLDLIPYLQQIVTKQNELIVEERKKIGQEELLIDALEEVATKKETLIPLIADLVNALGALKIALTAQKAQLTALMTAKIALITAKIDTMQARLETAQKKAEVEAIENEIYVLKLEIDALKEEAAGDAAKVEADHLMVVSTRLPTDLATLKSDAETTANTIKTEKTTNATTEATNKIVNQNAIGTSNMAADNEKAYHQNRRVKETANIQAMTEVTASLSHLLSM